MKILVTGSKGQIVSSLAERAASLPHIRLVAVGRPELDLTDPSSVRNAILSRKPDVVVSAAAYTAVDKAESEQELAHAVNVVGAACVAQAAAEIGVPVIHLSTDYVFAGEGRHPHHEDCETAPQTVYGRTKLGGERAVADTNPRHIILRTSWVYGPFGTNFVRTMLRIAKDHDTVSVVSDQWGNPTSALDVADAVLWIVPQLAHERFGIYHMAGKGETNWAGFARHIFDVSRENGGPFAETVEIATADFPAKARRPLNSRLSSDRFERTFGWRTCDWRSSTETVVRRLVLGGMAYRARIPATS